MQSDLDAMKQSGGSAPAPKPFTPPELIRDFSSRPTPPPPPPPSMAKITPSDFTTPKPASVVSPSGPVAKTPVIEEEKQGKNWMKMFIWGGAFVLIIGAGVAGYLFVYPMLFPSVPPVPAPAITVPPIAEIPTTPEAPLSPIPVEPKAHVSLLASAGSASPVFLASPDLGSLKSALMQEAQKPMASGSLTEVAISDAGGQVQSSVVLPLMLSELTADTVANLFEGDFTTAIYSDANGSWPAYIFKLSANSSIVEGQSVTGSLEASPNLGNLFLSDPGAPVSGGFKTGQVNGIATRYLPYAKTGASLNMAWSQDKLIISTSYNGLKKVLSSLAQ